MADYFDGAIMAYRDCAELMRIFQKRLPPGDLTKPIKEMFLHCEVSFDMKADEVIRQVREARARK